MRSSWAFPTYICDVGSPTPYVLAAPDRVGIRSGRLTGGDIQADPTELYLTNAGHLGNDDATDRMLIALERIARR